MAISRCKSVFVVVKIVKSIILSLFSDKLKVRDPFRPYKINSLVLSPKRKRTVSIGMLHGILVNHGISVMLLIFRT